MGVGSGGYLGGRGWAFVKQKQRFKLEECESSGVVVRWAPLLNLW